MDSMGMVPRSTWPPVQMVHVLAGLFCSQRYLIVAHVVVVNLRGQLGQLGRDEVAANYIYCQPTHAKSVSSQALKSKPTTGPNMLESWQFTSSHTINDALDTSRRRHVCFDNCHRLRRVDVLLQLLSRLLVPDNGENIATGVESSSDG